MMHEEGFIHRDLKPANIVFGLKRCKNEDIAYLIDFGLSKPKSSFQDNSEPSLEIFKRENL